MKTLLFLTLTFVATTVFGQNDLSKTLDNSSWSCGDSTILKNHEIMVVSFSTDSITHSYLDWINGYYANRCSYNSTITDSFFELELGTCREAFSGFNYIYGYFIGEKLNILFTDKRHTDLTEAKKQPDWILFDRVIE